MQWAAFECVCLLCRHHHEKIQYQQEHHAHELPLSLEHGIQCLFLTTILQKEVACHRLKDELSNNLYLQLPNHPLLLFLFGRLLCLAYHYQTPLHEELGRIYFWLPSGLSQLIQIIFYISHSSASLNLTCMKNNTPNMAKTPPLLSAITQSY